MTPQAPTRTLLLLFACVASATAQTTAPPPIATKARAKPRSTYQAPYNPNVVVLDPAHGGSDEGASLGKAGSEKDLNVELAERVRTLLAAQSFTVVLTHASAGDTTTGDQRAELANRSRAVACLLFHATRSGRGIHLYTAALTPAAYSADSGIAPWDSAQATSLPQSQQLASELATSLNGLKVPLVVTSASVSPIDSMSCPAVAIEVAAATPSGSVADDAYQQHIAESIVTALTYWRQHAKERIAAAEAAANAANTSTPPAGDASAPKPKPKPKPKPVTVDSPDESPLMPDAPAAKSAPRPAPIVRQPPATLPAPPPGDRP